MLQLQDITYLHPNRDLLFSGLNLAVNRHDKMALIGNNGTGKSTLLKLMAGTILPASGSIKRESDTYYLPQLYGQFNALSIARALGIADKLDALKKILAGDVTESNLEVLGDDWSVEERCREALAYWELDVPELTQKMHTLSGGQKTKVFLAGIRLQQPEIVLLDEPSNHLDKAARKKLNEYVQSTTATVVLVSHDRTLLNLADTVCELSKRGITVYGGNYDFYVEQKQLEEDALQQSLKSKEKELRKAQETAKDALERKQRNDVRGKKKQEKAGVPKIFMNTLRNKAEQSSSRLKNVHAGKTETAAKELNELRKELPGTDKMKIDFDNSTLHRGKVLAEATAINFGYNEILLWQKPLDFEISSGERISIEGGNGSGKTTLIKMILGELQPQYGMMKRAAFRAIYIDQEYLFIDNTLTVYEQAEQVNSGALQEYEIKLRLNRFLFPQSCWDKPCSALSGGEKMRLMLCCLAIRNQAPDMIILDEPTNNLDIQNIEILTEAINGYAGTVLVVSHDQRFLEEINTTRSIVTE